MSQGFESAVRPHVIPQFRLGGGPQVVTDDVGANTVIGASSTAQVIKLTRSEQSSWSRSKPVETQRVVTVQRIKQKLPDGTINPENYVDVEAATKITTDGPIGTDSTYYLKPGEEPHIQTLETGKVINNPDVSGGGAAP